MEGRGKVIGNNTNIAGGVAALEPTKGCGPVSAEADAPVFGFGRAGQLQFLNSACESFLRNLPPSENGRTESAIEDLRSLAAKLFDHRTRRTLERIGNPVAWRKSWRVCYSFVQPDPAGEPQTVSLLVVPAERPSHPWTEHERPVVDEQRLRQVLDTVNITEAEYEVARLLWEGKLIKRIAFELHRSISTVKFHSARLFRRCGVSRRPEWMAWLTSRFRSLS